MVGARSRSPFPGPGHQDSPPGRTLLGCQASPAIAPELHAAALGSRETGLGAGRHEPGLELGHSDHVLQQELVRGAFDHWQVDEPHNDAASNSTPFRAFMAA